MRIFLTGGTGFIGSHFLDQALEAGYSVTALRRSKDRQPRIAIGHNPIWIDADIDQVKADQLHGIDTMVHLATHTGNVPYDSLVNCIRWNLSAALVLFEQARIAGIKRYVVAGSCFEYGRTAERFGQVPTDACLEPTNSYAVSKAVASIAFMQWAQQHNLSMDILRVFHVFGEGEADGRFWPSLRRAALAGEDFVMTKGEQIRDFLSVQDAASIFLSRSKIQPREQKNACLFNIGSGNHQSLKDFAEFWWRRFEAKGSLLIGEVPYRDSEVMRFVPGQKLIIPKQI